MSINLSDNTLVYTWTRELLPPFEARVIPERRSPRLCLKIAIHLGNRDAGFWDGFHEELYQRALASTVAYLNEIKPYLWRHGETYPATPTELNHLFANHDVDFTTGYGPAFASVLIEKGEFPPTTRTFLFAGGDIAGALVTINVLMSFEQAIEFSRELDHAYPHRLYRLTPEQLVPVQALPRGRATFPISYLAERFLPDPDAEYLTRLEKGSPEKVLRR
jgi:putative spermidine/putrescine transport system substrate-binding protein